MHLPTLGFSPGTSTTWRWSRPFSSSRRSCTGPRSRRDAARSTMASRALPSSPHDLALARSGTRPAELLASAPITTSSVRAVAC